MIKIKISLPDTAHTEVWAEVTKRNENGYLDTYEKNHEVYRSVNVDRCIRKYTKKYRIRSCQVDFGMRNQGEAIS